jgi:acetyltransferase-like isoleucine patch superfamily enzyme
VPPARVTHPERIEIGADVVIHEGAALLVGDGGRLRVGDGARLNPFATIVCEVEVVLEDEVSSGDGVAILDSAGPAWDRAPVVVEAGAYLGFGSIVWPGVRIGRGAFVGEGAVVMSDVPAHTLVGGNPARVVG